MSAYGSLCTEFYDLDKPSAPADALAFYVARARKVGGRILEPMCGSGRFLLPMSLYRVHPTWLFWPRVVARWSRPTLMPNPSLKRSANGRPPAPGRWYTVHFHRPGAGVLRSPPA